jgi:hypothetical protein
MISDYQTEDTFQKVNTAPGLWELRGWPGTEFEGWVLPFSRDYEANGDHLLYHTTTMAKALKMFTSKERKVRFYDPPEVPDVAVMSEEERSTVATVDRLHRRWDHATAQEMTRRVIAGGAFGVTAQQIALWKRVRGDFCTGCIEGSLRSHAKLASSQPIKDTAELPGDVGAADLMFIEGRGGVKEPMYIHVDVATDFIFTVPMRGKSIEACMEAFDAVQAQYRLYGWELKLLVFDRESAIVAGEQHIIDAKVLLRLKASGQKVGVAEANIGIVRRKARSAKAGVRERYGYLPSELFHKDLVGDVAQVQNRLPKEGKPECPYGLFTGKAIDYLRDFRCEWGELLIVHKPKGIAADLGVVGQWAAVVRRIMNGTGVLKVYLVTSGKYAYRLHFRRAKAPQWVISKMASVSLLGVIGFEDEAVNPDGITGEGNTVTALSDAEAGGNTT